jgi:hypothetical protein
VSPSLIPLMGEEVPTLLKLENQSAGGHSVFRIEDSKSRVSIASVKLSVSDLTPEDGNLVGEYSIVVPLMKSKNDKGTIILPLNQTIDDLGVTGGVLRGQVISYKEGTNANQIICEIIPEKDQKILLEITTDNRTLEFKSRYTIVESKKGS